MKRLLTAAAAVVATGALTALSAVPAGAQEIPDVPELGFEIDPLEGPVGSTVEGLVDTDDVAQHCITDPVDFVGQFVDPENPLGGPNADIPPYFLALEEYVLENFPFFGSEFEEDPVHFAAIVAAFFPVGLAVSLPIHDGDGELAEDALSQTFIMAFADLETASPIEPLGSFDRNTGDGSTEVPDIEPGIHPVIATCVGLPDDVTVDDIAAAIDVAAAFIEANIDQPYPSDILDPEGDFVAAAGQAAPVLLQELVEPKALGFEFFCIFDESGECPDDGVPPGPPTDDDEAPPAEAVVAQPDFTG